MHALMEKAYAHHRRRVYAYVIIDDMVTSPYAVDSCRRCYSYIVNGQCILLTLPTVYSVKSAMILGGGGLGQVRHEGTRDQFHASMGPM